MSLIAKIVNLKAITRRRVVIASIVLLILILLISFVPTFAARHIVTSTLNDFGIEHEGIKSIKVNPWKREIWAGPVLFRTGDGDQGQLGELGLKVKLFPFLQKHAMVERILIRGVDIIVARAKDNTLTLNGIPLDQFVPDIETPGTEQPTQKSKPWGAGIRGFEMLDSRLIFKEKTGGTLKVEIESLRLGDFTSWLPDAPGTFELKARVNDIELDLKGQARPFAQHITINVDSDARGAELPKIIEFTGPLGLEKTAGIYNSTLHHEITLFDNGRLEGLAVGKIALIGADYSQVDRFAIKAERADFDLDIRYNLTRKDRLQVDGQLTMDLVNTDANLSNENAISIGTARAVFSKLSASHDADGNLNVVVTPKLNINQAAYSGRMQLPMDALMDFLRTLQSISAEKQISKEDTGLAKWSGEEVTLPKSDIMVKKFGANISELKFNTIDGKVLLDLVSDNEVTGIKLATADRTFDIDTVRSNLSTFRLNSGAGKTGLILRMDNVVSGAKVIGPIGEGTIKTIKFGNDVDLQIDRGDIAIQGSSKAGLNEIQLQVHKSESLPRADVAIAAVNANVQKATFVVKKQQIKWQVDSSASITSPSINYDEGKLFSAKFQRLEWNGARADQDFNIATDTLVIIGLEGLVTRQFIDGVLKKPYADSLSEKSHKLKNNITSEKPADTVIEENREEQNTTVSEKPTEDKPVEFNLKLGRLELVNGAHVRFLDQKVRPPILADLDIKTAKVRDIDTRSQKKTPYAELVATINEFTHLELFANANNAGPEMDMELKGKLDHLELPPYSSYAAEFGGINLETGQFNTNVGVTATKGVLDGAIKLFIEDLKFTPLSAADEERLSDKAGMPIETAASLLKDAKGNIELSLPVSGTVVDPEVDISSAINKAIGKTLKAIFPPTLIGSLLSSITADDKQTFKPVLFSPGSSELNKEAKVYLDDLATLLNQRPTLSFDICGRATPDDFKEITLVSLELPPNPKPAAVERRKRLIDRHGPRLLELATERTRVVRRYLITTKGLNARQVGECRLRFNPDDTEPPRVIVTL